MCRKSCPWRLRQALRDVPYARCGRLICFVIMVYGLLAASPVASETKHTIQKGDTIYQLSKKYDVPTADILKANPEVKPSRLKIGDILIIPDKKTEPTPEGPKKEKEPAASSEAKLPTADDVKPDSKPPAQEQKPGTQAEASAAKVVSEEKTHLVIRGDTLIRISRLYGISIDKIKEINDLKSDRIYVGQKLKVNLLPVESPKASKETTDSVVEQDKPAENLEKASQNQNQQKEMGGKQKEDAKPAESAHEDSTKLEAAKEEKEHNKKSEKIDSKEEKKELDKKPSQEKKKEEEKEKKESKDSTEDENVSAADAKRRKKNRENLIFVSKVLDQIESPRRFRRWKYIVVHNSGTASGNAKIFNYYHLNVRGMENGLAYHFVIGNGTDSGDGEIEVGARWRRQIQGGHVASSEMNEIAIGICLVGDFNKTRPTRRQIASLVELVNYLNQRFSRPRFKVHREINIKPTDCPGRYFPVDAMHRLFG